MGGHGKHERNDCSLIIPHSTPQSQWARCGREGPPSTICLPTCLLTGLGGPSGGENAILVLASCATASFETEAACPMPATEVTTTLDPMPSSVLRRDMPLITAEASVDGGAHAPSLNWGLRARHLLCHQPAPVREVHAWGAGVHARTPLTLSATSGLLRTIPGCVLMLQATVHGMTSRMSNINWAAAPWSGLHCIGPRLAGRAAPQQHMHQAPCPLSRWVGSQMAAVAAAVSACCRPLSAAPWACT